MFEKAKLKKKIRNSEKRIAVWEQKRNRSQAALLNAILRETSPSDADVEYFNGFSAKIETERAILQKYMSELEKLQKK